MKLNTVECKGNMKINECVEQMAEKWLQFHLYWLNRWGMYNKN